MFIGKVNNLFNVDAINRKFNRNTTNEEEKGFLRNDMASRQAKACSIAFYSFHFLYSFCLFYSAVMMRYLSYIFIISYFIPIWNSDHREILISQFLPRITII